MTELPDEPTEIATGARARVRVLVAEVEGAPPAGGKAMLTVPRSNVELF